MRITYSLPKNAVSAITAAGGPFLSTNADYFPAGDQGGKSGESGTGVPGE